MKDEYFGKFRKLRYQRQAGLGTKDLPQLILWVDEDLVEDTPFRRSIDQVLGVMGLPPKGVEIVYANQADAVDEVGSGLYSLVILDNDSYRGRAQGPQTLEDIRGIDSDIPIVYTSDAETVGDEIKQNVSEVVLTHQITIQISMIVQKYLLEEE